MADDTENKPAKKGKLPIIIAGAVLVAGGAAFAMTRGGAAAAPAAGAGAAGPKSDPTTLGQIVALDSFIVNLNEERSTRYLKVTFSVELAEADEAAVTERKDIIRDAVITYLSGLTIEHVRGSETKAAIRDELLQRINGALSVEGGVRNVVFTEFVVQ